MNDRTKDYVFVSYSHSDDIHGILQQFEAHGYNLVYDQAMGYGEEWDLNARRYIQSSKCKGVLSFLSRNSLCSKPVLMETEYAERLSDNVMGKSERSLMVIEKTELLPVDLKTEKTAGDYPVLHLPTWDEPTVSIVIPVCSRRVCLFSSVSSRPTPRVADIMPSVPLCWLQRMMQTLLLAAQVSFPA